MTADARYLCGRWALKNKWQINGDDDECRIDALVRWRVQECLRQCQEQIEESLRSSVASSSSSDHHHHHQQQQQEASKHRSEASAAARPSTTPTDVRDVVVDGQWRCSLVMKFQTLALVYLSTCTNVSWMPIHRCSVAFTDTGLRRGRPWCVQGPFTQGLGLLISMRYKELISSTSRRRRKLLCTRSLQILKLQKEYFSCEKCDFKTHSNTRIFVNKLGVSSKPTNFADLPFKSHF